MKAFILKSVFFVVLFFVLEKIFFVFIFNAPSLENDRRLEKVLKGNLNKELYIIGSSRGARNIIASQIKDSLKISCFNLSYPGSNIVFHEFILKAIVKHNKTPKIILLTVDDMVQFFESDVLTFRFERLYPLVYYNYVNDLLIERGEKTFLSQYLALARVNRVNFRFKKRKAVKLDALMDCGSMPIPFQKEGLTLTYKTIKESYDRSLELVEKIDAFKSFQNICAENKIKLFVVFSPMLRSGSSLFEKRIKMLSLDDVNFIKFNDLNTAYKKNDFYYDEGHLNTKGAIVFTNDIISNLKKETF
tara:strand:+ start:69 stop:977 length:909 start_codon:yes stop_codon:yes gene_type:complete